MHLSLDNMICNHIKFSILVHLHTYGLGWTVVQSNKPSGLLCHSDYWLRDYTSDCGDHVIVYLMQWWRKAWKAVSHELCGMWPFCLLPIRRGSGCCPFHICCWWSTEFSCGWDKSTCIYCIKRKSFAKFRLSVLSNTNDCENCRMLLYLLASHNWKVDLSK